MRRAFLAAARTAVDTHVPMAGGSSNARAERRGLTVDLILVAGAALAVRLIYLLEFRTSPFFDFLHLDPRYYHDWAAAIAGGDWLGKEIFEQSPLYPYLLAIYFVLVGRGLFLLRLIQFALGALTSVLTCLLGRRIFGRAAGLAAGLGAAVYGPFLFYEGQVMKEFLTPLLSAATLLLLYRGLRGGRGARMRFGWAGACIGAASLVRDNFLLLLPVFAVYLLSGPRLRAADGEAAPAASSARGSAERSARSRGARRRGLGDAAALAAGALVVLLPVAFRNHHVGGEWVLTTSGGGEVFYIGNGPYANGAYVVPPWVRSNPRYEHDDFRKRALQITGRPLGRGEASRFWYREGLKAITDDPLRWGRLLVRKAMLFLNDHELPDNYSFTSFRRFSAVLRAAPTFGWLAALAAPGLIASAARFRDLTPLYLAGLGYMASVMLFFNFARFRLPFIPILLLFAGEGAAVLWRSLSDLRSPPPQGRPRRKAALYAAAAGIAFAFAHVDLSSGAEEPFQDRLHLAAAYRQAGRSGEAEAILKETIRDAEAVLSRHGWKPGSPAVPGGITFALSLHAAHRDLAALLLAAKRTDEAIAELLSALPLNPEDADLYQTLGGAYREKGDPRSAARAYERGLALAPSSFTLRFDLATALYEAGDTEAALAEMTRARPRAEELGGLDLADWHYGMGTVLYALGGRGSEALQHFREGLRLNPDHPQAAEVRTILASSGG